MLFRNLLSRVQATQSLGPRWLSSGAAPPPSSAALSARLAPLDIPAMGFGTWQLQGDKCKKALSAALKAGYRHIDTAAVYVKMFFLSSFFFFNFNFLAHFFEKKKGMKMKK